ncbi:MAG: redoxin domain-containing protein [Planctomycetales bacterium]|nr:redoxin domain-containing protein [Planctomycetales bacterium]
MARTTYVMLIHLTFALAISGVAHCWGQVAEPPSERLASQLDATVLGPVTAFQLPSLTGEEIVVQPENDGAARFTVLCFLGTECPLAKLYGPRLQQMSEAFDDTVRFLGINSNQQDSVAEIAAYAKECGIRFPMGKDRDNVVADLVQAVRTPEVIVLDRQLRVQYRGRIDDQYLPGVARYESQERFLEAALRELLAGKPVTHSVTEAVGCFIGRVKKPVANSGITYCQQVSRIFQAHCIECHRQGEIGPFSMTEYDEVVGWVDTIVEVIEDHRMPPWHASPEFGHYANARVMTADEKETVRRWVEAGAPYGDAQHLPESRSFTTGWQLPREPDMVIAMRDRPFTIPADGTVEYQYFVVDPGFKEDKWITAAQVIPGDRTVVHHSIVFVRPPDGADFRGVGWLGAYVPGHRPGIFPGGGRRVPAGSKLVFQQHYTPTGTERHDVTKVGILFGTDDEVTHEQFTLVGIDQGFEIPPYAADVVVAGRVRRLPDDGLLLAIMPHMHLRGRSFRLFVREQNDDRSQILEVPNYDFNWQHSYELAEPYPLRGITSLDFEVIFDNSDANPVNPDPSQHVMWGDQTWEEMAVAFFEVAEPRQPATLAENQDALAQVSITNQPAAEEATDQRVAEYVKTFLERFDANHDGEVSEYEVPLSIRRFGFRRMDRNGDDRLDQQELREAAR